MVKEYSEETAGASWLNAIRLLHKMKVAVRRRSLLKGTPPEKTARTPTLSQKPIRGRGRAARTPGQAWSGSIVAYPRSWFTASVWRCLPILRRERSVVPPQPAAAGYELAAAARALPVSASWLQCRKSSRCFRKAVEQPRVVPLLPFPAAPVPVPSASEPHTHFSYRAPVREHIWRHKQLIATLCSQKEFVKEEGRNYPPQANLAQARMV